MAHPGREDQLPPPLMTSDPGSYARRTIVEGKPENVRHVREDSDYPPEIVQNLEALAREIQGEVVQPLTEEADDTGFWNDVLGAWAGRTWLDIGWYFAESFFYRRLLQAVRYLQPGEWQGHDPFWKAKRQQEREAIDGFSEAWSAVLDAGPKAAFQALLHASLWGNRADLSNYSMGLQMGGGGERENILIDDTGQVQALLRSGLGDVAFINDNSGADLLYDLALADFVLQRGWAKGVDFHAKDRPFFASDAMPQDVALTVARLRTAPEPSARELVTRLTDALAQRRLRVHTHPFWTRSLGFRAMAPDVRDAMVDADLVILKGDVNYRRLLDDRRWPHATPLEVAAGDFPRPFLVVRTLKGEIMVGLAPGQAEALTSEDPEWMTNGRRGIIQLVQA